MKDSKSQKFIQSLEEIIIKIPLRSWAEESEWYDIKISGPDYYSPSYGSDDDPDGYSDSPSLDYWDRRVFERGEFFTYTTKIDSYVLKIQGCRKYNRVTKGYDNYLSEPGKFGKVELIINEPRNISGVYGVSNNTRLFFIDLFQRYPEYKKQLEIEKNNIEEEALNKERKNLLKKLKGSVE